MAAWHTAIARHAPSAPVRWLERRGMIRAGAAGDGLDFGAGRGYDAEFMGYSAFDPHFAPDRPRRQFSTVLCIYVLNVIASAGERRGVLLQIVDYLKPGGRAFVAVRRDIPRSGTATQHWVALDGSEPGAPVLIEENRGFALYMLRK